LIEKYTYFIDDFQKEAPRELMLLSIISQSFFQSFSLEDNLLVILTALTSGSGVGFNRAMLFLAEGDKIRGEMWLGPRTREEAKYIWEVLSTPGIGYIEIIEHNRSLVDKNADTLSARIKSLSYSLHEEPLLLPALSASKKEIFIVRDAGNEPLVDKKFLETIGVNDFLCIPLYARDETMGEIVLDNAITNAPIEAKDIKLASICGLIAGNYIYATSLHAKMVEMEKLAALGEMAMFITHQLRNPLVTIGGFTDQLLNAQVEKEKQKRNLDIIKEEIRRLEKVVFELGHLLRVDLKKPVSIEVQPIIKSVLQSTDIKIKKKGREVRPRIEKNLPRILCEPTYLGEVLRNLLDNAFDATPPAGKIFVHVYRENKNWLVISVKDTGLGIPEHLKEKMFKPFFSTKEKGIGLGLLFVKRVMDAYGGKIEVESEEGKGAKFKLYFKCEEGG
jgi:hypothetical protein